MSFDVKKVIEELKKAEQELIKNPNAFEDLTKAEVPKGKDESAKDEAGQGAKKVSMGDAGGTTGKIYEAKVRDPEEVSMGRRRKSDMVPGAREIVHLQESSPFAKDEMLKDDAPHQAGSPEDSAHDVMEEGSSLQSEMKMLPYAEQKAKFLAHLRTLKAPSDLRSPQNEAVGMAKDSKLMEGVKGPQIPSDKPMAAPKMPAKGSQVTIQDKKVNPASVNQLADKGMRVKTVFKSYDMAKSEFLNKSKKKAKK